jgi:competence protein ComEA
LSRAFTSDIWFATCHRPSFSYNSVVKACRLYPVLPLLAILFLVFTACSSNPDPIFLTSFDPRFSGQVYIGGGVNAPGIYPYRLDDTLSDLIQAAGGLQSGADAGQVKVAVSSAGSAEAPQKIDLNRADTWLLEALPGIGAATARSIVDYRRQYGPFRNLNDLLKVKDIGPAKLEKIKNFVTVADEVQ